MSEDPGYRAPAATEPVEIPLPGYLRSLQPHMMLRGWLLPVVFAVLALVFWAHSTDSSDWAPHRHVFEAYCFAAVAVFFVFARVWVGWRVRGVRTARRRDGQTS